MFHPTQAVDKTCRNRVFFCFDDECERAQDSLDPLCLKQLAAIVAHRGGSRNCRQNCQNTRPPSSPPQGKKGGMPLLPGEKRESDQYVSGLSFFDDIGKYIKLGAERMQVPD